MKFIASSTESMHRVQHILFDGSDFIHRQALCDANYRFIDHPGVYHPMEIEFWDSVKASLINVATFLKISTYEELDRLELPEIIYKLRDFNMFQIAVGARIAIYARHEVFLREMQNQDTIAIVKSVASLCLPFIAKEDSTYDIEYFNRLKSACEEALRSQLSSNEFNTNSYDIKDIAILLERLYDYFIRIESGHQKEFIPRVLEMAAIPIDAKIIDLFSPIFSYWDRWVQPEVELLQQMYVEDFCSAKAQLNPETADKCIEDVFY